MKRYSSFLPSPSLTTTIPLPSYCGRCLHDGCTDTEGREERRKRNALPNLLIFPRGGKERARNGRERWKKKMVLLFLCLNLPKRSLGGSGGGGRGVGEAKSFFFHDINTSPALNHKQNATSLLVCLPLSPSVPPSPPTPLCSHSRWRI